MWEAIDVRSVAETRSSRRIAGIALASPRRPNLANKAHPAPWVSTRQRHRTAAAKSKNPLTTVMIPGSSSASGEAPAATPPKRSPIATM